jgi:uncharacterized protein
MMRSCGALAAALLVAACSPERSQRSAATIPSQAAVEPARHSSAEPSKVAFEVPALRGRVNDYADILTPVQETELAGLYEANERAVGSQIAVLTIQSLGGVPIKEYSLAVANTWGLGRLDIDDGVLITIAFAERLSRIEVGYGLELVISDQDAADVLRRMGGEFAAGNMFAGIRMGSKEIIQRIQANQDLVGKRRP